MRRKKVAHWLLGAMLAVLVGFAHAHKPSDSYLTLRAQDDAIEGQWDIALRDLDLALGLDADQDGTITWGEVRTRHGDIAAHAFARLQVTADGDSCAVHATDHLIDHHSDGAYAVLRFRTDCPSAAATLGVDYRLLFDLDPQHRGLLQVERDGVVHTAIFSAEAPTQKLMLSQPARWRQFADYFQHGVWHIWMGFDHILFLLALLLPAVLVRDARGWHPAERFGATLWEVTKIVTAFTLAHSLTLTLSALGVFSIPARWVESAIAASVALAALNNVFPVVRQRLWVLAFVFGLIHGFGFASVLIDLGLPRAALLTALVAFNVGVEAGQLVIVAAFLPLAWWLRERWVYRKLTVYGGSVAVLALALAWLAERALNVSVLS